jgi:MFS family permease
MRRISSIRVRLAPVPVPLSVPVTPAAGPAQVSGRSGLAWLQLSWAAMIASNWAYAVAIAVFAYNSGGAGDVGLALVARSLPALVGAPVTGLVAARLSGHRALVASGAVTALALGGSGALVAAAAPAMTVYALGALVAVAMMMFRQAQSAVLPALAGTGGRLAAANAAATTIEGVGMLAGPALASLVLAVGSATAVFGLTAAAALLATAAAAAAQPRAARRSGTAPGARAAGAVSGFREATAESPVPLILALLLAQTVVSGALNVLMVVSAVELLGLGQAGVGTLTAAYGLGGLLAGLGALAGARQADLGRWLCLGLLLWGVPLVGIGAAPQPALALALLTLVGVGNTMFDVASVTLLQRAVADHALAPLFGAVETVVLAGLGIGALLAPAVIDRFGIRAALVIAGAALPALVLASHPALRRLGAQATLPAAA